jgi:hypothetical protein
VTHARSWSAARGRWSALTIYQKFGGVYWLVRDQDRRERAPRDDD